MQCDWPCALQVSTILLHPHLIPADWRLEMMLSQDYSLTVCSESPKSCHDSCTRPIVRCGENGKYLAQVQQQTLFAIKNEAGPQADPQDDKMANAMPQTLGPQSLPQQPTP